MKNFIIYFMAFILASCAKEGEQAVLTGFEAAILSSTSDDVLLEQESAKNIGLQLVWNQPELNTSSAVGESLIKTTIQFSTDKNFTTIDRSVESIGAALTYTHQQLNRIVLAMGLQPDNRQYIYVRLASKLANNVTVKYSNVLSVAVTPYEETNTGDYLYMANKELTTFLWKLCSRKEDGFYDGFAKVDQWYKFYLTNEAASGASKIYGSYPVEGNQYVLYAGDDRWNCWTSNGGYLYITADVNKMEWHETVVTSLAATGDFNGWSTTANTLTYDAVNNVWTTTITTTAAEQWGMKILINGSWSWFFGIGENAGECGLHTGEASGFAYDKVGTHTLTLDLSDPKAFKYTIE